MSSVGMEGLSLWNVGLPKFSSELTQRTRTSRTEPIGSVQFRFSPTTPLNGSGSQFRTLDRRTGFGVSDQFEPNFHTYITYSHLHKQWQSRDFVKQIQISLLGNFLIAHACLTRWATAGSVATSKLLGYGFMGGNYSSWKTFWTAVASLNGHSTVFSSFGAKLAM